MALAVWGKTLIFLFNCSQSSSFECLATANISMNPSAGTQNLAKVKIFPFSHFMVPSFGLLDLLPQVKWTCTDLKLKGCAEEISVKKLDYTAYFYHYPLQLGLFSHIDRLPSLWVLTEIQILQCQAAFYQDNLTFSYSKYSSTVIQLQKGNTSVIGNTRF